MNKDLSILRSKLDALAIFRNLLNTPVVAAFQSMSDAISAGDTRESVLRYGEFCSEIYKEGGDLALFLSKFIREDENLYLIYTTKNAIISRSMRDCLDEELKVLQELSELSAPLVKESIDYENYLPHWDNAGVDLAGEYHSMLKNIPTDGYGIFSTYTSFKIIEGRIVPVRYKDPVTIGDLYGYELVRNKLLENTRALAAGKKAANALLFGDAGTGKSTTIKACANEFAADGVRLIEFDKSELAHIPSLIEELYDNPLKFIFYIDDLSFESEDDSFSFLKGILEGNATGSSDNIAIYATSNRRHLVRELAEDRTGTDIHIQETLQQTLSLSARFGLAITFSRPEKDLYLEIVDSLAKEYGLAMDTEELHRKAEAYAIRHSGRSPRTARHFVELSAIGL